MDQDIRDFLDKAEQQRLHEAKKKRKNNLLAKQIDRQKRKSAKIAAQSGADLLCGETIKDDKQLRQLRINGRDYSSGTKFKPKHRSAKEQKKFDWENRPRFISVPMGGQNK